MWGLQQNFNFGRTSSGQLFSEPMGQSYQSFHKNGIKESIHVHYATIKLWKRWATERIWLSAICNYICEENCVIKILCPKDWFSGRIMHNSINSIIWNSRILYSFVSVILTMMVYTIYRQKVQTWRRKLWWDVQGV